MVRAHGVSLKKKYGQHFLREQSVVDTMIHAVHVTPHSSIFEIGCGDGFLTRSILQTSCARLWVFEIDPEWATYVQATYPDPRLTVSQENILDVDFAPFEPDKPWILLANLPYQITFPILRLLQKNKAFLQEGVIMVQHEVADKILKTSGRGYGYISLFFQHHFVWKSLLKIAPTAFYPPPAVHSRLLHFTPRHDAPSIPHEEKFWDFIKLCFMQPRRTLKNNLMQSHYGTLLEELAGNVTVERMLLLRAQQMGMQDFLMLWQLLNQ